MKLKSLISVSLPTKDQVVKGVEIVAVTYVAAFAWTWAHSPNPFSKAALVGAGAAGLAAIYALVKGFLTNV